MRDAVVDAVSRAHKDGLSYGQQAVLNRDNLDNERYASSLRKAGIPVLYVGELARRPEVKRLLCLMQLLVERSPRALVGLMGVLGLSVDLASLRIMIDACAANPHLQRGGWLQEFPEGLSSSALTALAKVRGQALPCTYAIPSQVAGGQVDPGLVNVELTPAGGATSTLPQDQTCAKVGWRYDNPTKPTQIDLCPQSCTALKALGSAKVQILLGCVTQTT